MRHLSRRPARSVPRLGGGVGVRCGSVGAGVGLAVMEHGFDGVADLAQQAGTGFGVELETSADHPGDRVGPHVEPAVTLLTFEAGRLILGGLDGSEFAVGELARTRRCSCSSRRSPTAPSPVQAGDVVRVLPCRGWLRRCRGGAVLMSPWARASAKLGHRPGSGGAVAHLLALAQRGA